MVEIKEINGFPNLEYLCLYSVKLDLDFFFSASDLIKLKLVKCDLSHLQWKEIACLDRLRALEIDSPKESCMFKLNCLNNLHWLSLCNLNLKFFHDILFIKTMHKKLIGLELKAILNSTSDLMINRLFSESEYESLKQLDLSGNSFTKISKFGDRDFFNSSNFVRLRGLEVLNLDNNKIEIIEPDSFAELKNLKTLILAGFDPDMLNGLVKLKKLDLSHNGLTLIST